MNLFRNHFFVMLFALAISGTAFAGQIATITTKVSSGDAVFTAEGVVEAVKSSVVSAQVTGTVTTLMVKSGDAVKSGQLLVRVDTRLAEQQGLTNQAQVQAAQAQLTAARSEYERKQHLYEKQYISKAAMERAESEFKSAEAAANATRAISGMSRVQIGMHALTAPYAGVVSEVMTEIGSMVIPDKPLLSIYDPDHMRVVASVPQSQLASIKNGAAIQVEIAGRSVLTGTDMRVLPVADPVSHVVQVRIQLPVNTRDITPGMFARVNFPIIANVAGGRIHVPMQSIVRRSELTAVYVLDRNGHPHLRQLRLGRQRGGEIEILSGLSAGEQVVLDPLMAVGR